MTEKEHRMLLVEAGINLMMDKFGIDNPDFFCNKFTEKELEEYTIKKYTELNAIDALERLEMKKIMERREYLIMVARGEVLRPELDISMEGLLRY